MIKNILVSASVIVVVAILAYLITPDSKLYSYFVGVERVYAGLELKKLEVDGLEVEYLRGGSGHPLILLHGFGANKDNWNRISRYLVQNFDVVAIDLPGFGNSTKSPDIDYDVRTQVERLRSIVDALNIDNFNMAGSSMGGYIAGNFAAKYPENVQSLWLISPFGVKDSELSEMFELTQKGLHPVVLPRTGREFAELMGYLFVSPPYIPSPILDHLAAESELNIDVNEKAFNQIHRMKGGTPHPELPLDKILASYTGPVLISWGERDRILHWTGSLALKKAIPHAKIEIIKNTGHLPMVESPEKTAMSFLSFYGD
ncbi:alpha/beta hydrolase [Pseudomonas sp. 32.2.56]|uniref:alpha/beta fold hydrolase n=1 Tax=Pseudomonas TaxID=286 RepID=UPI001F46640C|nr:MULTISPECIES: alpha/beta hydrolase [Pseudomonas]MCE5365274.1 alpha/beta hydrolase [Pseudomonas anguilliseptica]MCR4510494.1 alpha/beta hydrolase [Pseudomonas sp. 32.2.56]